MDNDLKYTFWNKASEILTGIPSEKAIGKSIYDIFPGTINWDTCQEEVDESSLKLENEITGFLDESPSTLMDIMRHLKWTHCLC